MVQVIASTIVGKSNLMDAISFVLGISSRRLRSDTLSELIYRDNSDEKYVAMEGSVKLV